MARKFVITTDSKNTQQATPDLLQRCFRSQSLNKAWVSDTTFIPTQQGCLYLPVILDLYSRQVIRLVDGELKQYRVGEDALTMAIWRRGDMKNVIVHSDQGSTYTLSRYQKQLRDNQLRCSMSRKGECLDNAVAESFFGMLKNELIYH